jgi:hypothetical protein
MTNFITMKYDDWVKKYRPLPNEVVGESAPFEGIMFETYGAEYDLLYKMAERFAFNEGSPKNGYHVWTLVSGDNGDPIILSGWHVVNRLGYFITTIPWSEGEDIGVTEG